MTDRSVQHATITLERSYAASPSRVFAAWADPHARRRWFVEGSGWEVAEYHQDFRAGGREQGHFARKPGDPVYRNETLYYDILPARRIVFAYTMARDEARISASLATVELHDEGSGTRLVFTEQGAFLDGADQPGDREAGWRGLLDRLGAELAEA